MNHFSQKLRNADAVPDENTHKIKEKQNEKLTKISTWAKEEKFQKGRRLGR